ncbi:helix-turn-helix domain-containing protein [Paenibacillus apiarius]|uniref:helix-turn-helix domain-containing protein n=1 Tax=Paenibacillus apiarius TaxID=46240 RepID=UPI001F09B771|nr:helix-turn-helix domain-containing protein [Paenibacillus apiarius]
MLYKLSLKFGAPQSAIEGQDPQWVLKLTHQELASITGSIRETVTELLSTFAAEGIMDKEGLRKSLWVHTERLKEALDI